MNSDSTASAVTVEYDSDTETYRGRFDSTEIDPSLAVVEVMAHVIGTDPIGLDPLERTVDTESIDRLCTRSPYGRREGDLTVEFTYLGFDVTVKSYGIIDVEPVSADED